MDASTARSSSRATTSAGSRRRAHVVSADRAATCPAVRNGRELLLAAGCRWADRDPVARLVQSDQCGQPPKLERAENSQPTNQRLPRLQRILVDVAARVTCNARRIGVHAVDRIFSRLSAAAQQARAKCGSTRCRAPRARDRSTEPARNTPSHVTPRQPRAGGALSAQLTLRPPKCVRNQTRRARAVVNPSG